MFPTIYFSGETMLALSFVLLGLNSANSNWVLQGFILLVFPIISILMINFVNRVQKPLLEKRIYLLANAILACISGSIVGYIYNLGDINIYERIAMYIFFAWTFFSVIFFVKDLKQANVVIEKVSSVREIGINHSFKSPRK